MEGLLGAFAFTTQTTIHLSHSLSLHSSPLPSLTRTGMRTSSIKALRSLLQLSIRKLSLGFGALAYRHLDEAFSESAVSTRARNLHRIYWE